MRCFIPTVLWQFWLDNSYLQFAYMQPVHSQSGFLTHQFIYNTNILFVEQFQEHAVPVISTCDGSEKRGEKLKNKSTDVQTLGTNTIADSTYLRSYVWQEHKKWQISRWGIWAQQGLLVRIARYYFSTFRRLPYTCSKRKWTDNVTGKFLKMTSFLNVGKNHGLSLVEWISLDRKNRNISGNRKFGGS